MENTFDGGRQPGPPADPSAPEVSPLLGAFAEDYYYALHAAACSDSTLRPWNERRCGDLARHGLVVKKQPGWELTDAGRRALEAWRAERFPLPPFELVEPGA